MSTPALGYEVTDMLPTERTAIQEVINVANKRFKAMVNSASWDVKTGKQRTNAANDWRIETQNRLTEIGWVSEVKLAEFLIDKTTGEPVWCPEIVVYGKTTDEGELDHERVAHEVQHGLADGRAAMLRNGLWVDPSFKI